MTGAAAASRAAAQPPDVSFAGAVDLTLIHRRNADEAFLTDVVRTGPKSFVAAALLPSAHPHYARHTGPSRRLDPMLLLECARQAETYAAHALYGVEPDARFVLRNWSAEFAVDPPAPPRPAELVLTAVTRNPRVVRDRIRGLEYELELMVAGERAGLVRMEVGYVSAAAYAVIRSRRHDGPPPSSADVVPAAGRQVAPARVGRVRATDTLLLDVATAEGRLAARLRVPAENPSLFDHVQDHIPAMVLVEAARQLAALATHEWCGAAPDRTAMAAMSSSFAAYAELTEPVELTATPADAEVPAAGRCVDVSFRQTGAEIALARIVMAVPGGAAVSAGAAISGGAAEPGRRREATWLAPRS